MILSSKDFPLEALARAARSDQMIVAMRRLYEDLQSEIAAHGPTCWNKGECCRFGEYGHRLFVTTIEVAYYLANRPVNPLPRPNTSDLSLPVLEMHPTASGANRMGEIRGDVCPHVHGGKCHAREARPMGCRIFYCDPKAQAWQGPMTEEYLSKLRALHEQFNIPYVYADWMAFLAALDATNATSQ